MIREVLDELNLDAFYINYIPNIRYISGFSGSSAGILICKNKNYFITDFRYKDQSAAEVKGFEIIINYKIQDELNNIFNSEKCKRVGFESSRTIFSNAEGFGKNFEGVEMIPVFERIEKLTMQKTPEEIAKIKNAAEISDKTFSHLLKFIKPGMKELDVSAEITYMHKKFGAAKDSFDPIVASGWRGALPHGVASSKIINSGEMVTLDFGCVFEGFCSDITRTISVGEPTGEMKKIYSIVYEAQSKAIGAVKAGASSKDIDLIARNIIAAEGYGNNFGHGLGHGLGIDVHEAPMLNQRTDMALPENSVVTIEPGIYIEGTGGVRIEDDVLVTKDGSEVLNKSLKELIII